MPKHIKKREPTEILACDRRKLFCQECNEEVYAQCLTIEWYQHLSKSKFTRYTTDYHRHYNCLKCGCSVACHKGTYEPVSRVIPSKAVRLGRELTFNLVAEINKEFNLKRVEIAQCLGFQHQNDIKSCEDIEQLRNAYRYGVKLREELRRIEDGTTNNATKV